MIEANSSQRARRRFAALALATVAIIYALILVGGIVRATGSGMGCPDWPTCFGRWIPPTSETQLPPDYQQIYADRGYADTTFNVQKTWIEYLNRLLGVFTGFAIPDTTGIAGRAGSGRRRARETGSLQRGRDSCPLPIPWPRGRVP